MNVKADVDIGILSDTKIKELEYALGIISDSGKKGRSTFINKTQIKLMNIDPKVNVRFIGEIADQKEAQEFLQKASLNPNYKKFQL